VLASHSSSALRLGAALALRRMEDKGIAAFLQDDDPLVVRAAERGINDDWSIPAALPDLAEILTITPYADDEVIIRRSINANLRVGTPEALDRVVSYASNEDNPRDLRIEALETARVWCNPSVLDRVDGRYRGPIQRSSKDYTAQLTKAIALLDDKSSKIKRALLKFINLVLV